MYAMIKNPISLWDIFTRINFCLNIKGSFYKEFKYLHYFLLIYINIWILNSGYWFLKKKWSRMSQNDLLIF